MVRLSGLRAVPLTRRVLAGDTGALLRGSVGALSYGGGTT